MKLFQLFELFCFVSKIVQSSSLYVEIEKIPVKTKTHHPFPLKLFVMLEANKTLLIMHCFWTLVQFRTPLMTFHVIELHWWFLFAHLFYGRQVHVVPVKSVTFILYYYFRYRLIYFMSLSVVVINKMWYRADDNRIRWHHRMALLLQFC